MTYSITKEIRIHHKEDGWFYQFTNDGEGIVEITQYTTHGIEERKTGEPFYIPKDCIIDFIEVLTEMR